MYLGLPHTTTAAENIPVKRAVRRPWITSETMDIIDQKKEARLKGNHDEWKRLKGVYKARSKVYLELFYGKLADEAESGFKKNNLRPAYGVIKRLRGSTRSTVFLLIIRTPQQFEHPIY